MSYFDIAAPLSAYRYNQKVLKTIKAISLPLLENFGIELVTYRRFFDNGNLLHISADLNWLDHCYSHHHWTSHSTIKRIKQTSFDQPFVNIWNKSPDPNDSVYGALHAFGFINGATIYERNTNSTELWAFSGVKDCHNIDCIYSNYNNNQSVLKRFILYFQDKAKDILDVTDRSKIIPGDSSLFKESCFIQDPKIKKFEKETEISKYFLKGISGDFIITRREAQCLYYLCQGKSMKEVANVLAINWRTVDTFVNNIKNKTGINSTNRLLEAFYSTAHHWIF